MTRHAVDPPIADLLPTAPRPLMADRDSWTYALLCPTCQLAGHASVSENECGHPGGPQFRVDHLTAGFLVRHEGHTVMDTEIECGLCRELAG
jgi:hypothetical protein